MPSVEQTCRTYQDLATLYGEQGQAQLRDRFLVLAADALHEAGRAEEAERVRARLLQVNPHHLLKPFASLDEAMKTADVKNYVAGLRRTYPPEKAGQLLEALRSGAQEKPPEPPVKQTQETLRPDRLPPAPAPENLKVYRFKDEIDPEAPLPRTRPEPRGRPAPREVERPASHPPPVRPAAARPAHPLPSARHPAAPAPVWSQAPAPPAWGPGGPDVDPNEATAGAWVAASLFWILLLGGLALAGFTLAAPFLPQI